MPASLRLPRQTETDNALPFAFSRVFLALSSGKFTVHHLAFAPKSTVGPLVSSNHGSSMTMRTTSLVLLAAFDRPNPRSPFEIFPLLLSLRFLRSLHLLLLHLRIDHRRTGSPFRLWVAFRRFHLLLWPSPQPINSLLRLVIDIFVRPTMAPFLPLRILWTRPVCSLRPCITRRHPND